MYHSLFIHFPFDGHWGVPSFLAIRNIAAKLVFEHMFSFLLGKNIFEKNCLVIAAKSFSKMVVPFYTPSRNVKDSTCLIFYQQQMLLVFCGSALMCIYLIINIVSIFSTCFVPSSFINSSSEMPRPLTHFKIGQMVHLNCFIGVLCIGYLRVLCHFYIL